MQKGFIRRRGAPQVIGRWRADLHSISIETDDPELRRVSDEVLEKNVKVSPMGRIPTVDDIANAALFLACDATGITAQTIFVDCGVTALQPVV